MALPQRLSGAQCENLLTLLCHSDPHGKIVVGLIDAELFEGDYRVIAERVVDYWRRNGSAPKLHTGDLFADIIEDPGNRRSATYRRLLLNMTMLHEGINADYVLSQLKTFTRLQRLKEAIYAAAEQLDKPGETTIEQVEDILADILTARNFSFDPGAKLTEVDSLIDYLKSSASEFTTGIKEFDARGIAPRRGTIFMFIGGKGRGKTWWCINIGKRALLERKRVLHVSLENSEEETKMRYFQALYSVSKRECEKAKIPVLDYERKRRSNGNGAQRGGGVIGWHHEEVPLDFDLAWKEVELREELTNRLELLGQRAENLIIKRFPTRTLTPNMLRGYLDRLETVEGFIPDIVLLDYPKLMKTEAVRERNDASLFGRNIEDIRAIAVERNMAFVCPDQLTRRGYEAKQGRSTHIAESWAQVHAADTVVVHSATDAEMQHGLARLYVEHARTEADKFSVLITQSYQIGQFALESTVLSEHYMERLLPQHAQTDDAPYDEDQDDEDSDSGNDSDITQRGASHAR